MANFDILSVDNVRAILNELADIRQMSRKFTWLSRIPVVFAFDEEIMAYYLNRLTIASIIADDQRAPVRASNPIRLEQGKIPNLKHGRLIGQAQLAILERIESMNASRRDNNVFEDYLVSEVTNLRDGVAALMEYLLVAMLIDSLGYDEEGIKITAAWGMPSDLKVTPANLWTDAVNATPVSDIQAVWTTASQKYGIMFDRMTIPLSDFNNMTATAEFRNKAQLYNNIAFNAGTFGAAFPTGDIRMMQAIAGRIFNMVIEIDDRQVWKEAADASQAALRYQPLGKVILTNSELDGDEATWDFANGTVTETIRGTCPNMFGEFPESTEGPVSYYTAADSNGNPPGLSGWGVGRGFPRKHVKSSSAVLTVR